MEACTTWMDKSLKTKLRQKTAILIINNCKWTKNAKQSVVCVSQTNKWPQVWDFQITIRIIRHIIISSASFCWCYVWRNTKIRLWFLLSCQIFIGGGIEPFSRADFDIWVGVTGFCVSGRSSDQIRRYWVESSLASWSVSRCLLYSQTSPSWAISIWCPSLFNPQSRVQAFFNRTKAISRLGV